MPRIDLSKVETKRVMADFKGHFHQSLYGLERFIRDDKHPGDSPIPRLLGDMNQLLLKLDRTKHEMRSRPMATLNDAESFCAIHGRREPQFKEISAWFLRNPLWSWAPIFSDDLTANRVVAYLCAVELSEAVLGHLPRQEENLTDPWRAYLSLKLYTWILPKRLGLELCRVLIEERVALQMKQRASGQVDGKGLEDVRQLERLHQDHVEILKGIFSSFHSWAITLGRKQRRE
ncbi:hypothetical protein PV08_00859 [Exophiala spinifera]|uniref:Uncharacterized protein n=1 Tax=Exophiala spinifera TaxID=91928 RepID=A0A0D2C9M2_9EURO|nr:uncharacterized protein PV08_00859 [Exophiala spinifera]KIW20284.1 hypothetical protein PV08_00859 [Exophiala spinifera]